MSPQRHMNEPRRAYLTGGDDDEEAVFTLHKDDNTCRLSCSYRGRMIEATATDFFEALCKIRIRLWEERLIPFCYGASLNVYPSGMGRDMGRGLKAYKMIMGKHATVADLVDIFAEGPDVVPSTVETQKEFWEDWLATPRE